jgi:hypothetical protein
MTIEDDDGLFVEAPRDLEGFCEVTEIDEARIAMSPLVKQIRTQRLSS